MATAAPAKTTATALIRRILDTHHVYLRRELPILERIIGKMATNHGAERPELFQVQQLLQDLRDDLTAHLAKEEQVLFPYVQGVEAALESAAPFPHACFASVQFPIRMMFMEHDRAQVVLNELRSVTANYTPPKGTSCDCAKRFYAGLEALESDLLEHIRVENEDLFPLALNLEERAEACR